MEIFLVHSIKGGCGKSSIALSLAGRLAADAGGSGETKVCLLDMDFKSTGYEDMLVRAPTSNPKEFEDLSKPEPDLTNGIMNILRNKSHYYWSTCFFAPDTVISEKCITKFKMHCDKNVVFALDMFIADPNQSSRNRFIKSFTSTDGLNINSGLFQHVFRASLEWLQNVGYTSVIIDLPPSFDDYTSMVFSVLMDVRDGFIAKKRGQYLCF